MISSSVIFSMRSLSFTDELATDFTLLSFLSLFSVVGGLRTTKGYLNSCTNGLVLAS